MRGCTPRQQQSLCSVPQQVPTPGFFSGPGVPATLHRGPQTRLVPPAAPHPSSPAPQAQSGGPLVPPTPLDRGRTCTMNRRRARYCSGPTRSWSRPRPMPPGRLSAPCGMLGQSCLQDPDFLSTPTTLLFSPATLATQPPSTRPEAPHPTLNFLRPNPGPGAQGPLTAPLPAPPPPAHPRSQHLVWPPAPASPAAGPWSHHTPHRVPGPWGLRSLPPCRQP